MLLQDFLVDYDFTEVHTINKKARKRIFIRWWVGKATRTRNPIRKESLKNSSRRKRMGESIQDYLFDLQGYLVLENTIEKKRS
jgi:hypothetical protein